MAGNALEWVADWYDETYYASSADANPTGPESGDLRLLRGGSWLVNDYLVRSAFRNNSYPTLTIGLIGFRCSRSSP
jgi:formylglycine-generating enzyme required for sulfatase activity